MFSLGSVELNDLSFPSMQKYILEKREIIIVIKIINLKIGVCKKRLLFNSVTDVLKGKDSLFVHQEVGTFGFFYEKCFKTTVYVKKIQDVNHLSHRIALMSTITLDIVVRT